MRRLLLRRQEVIVAIRGDCCLPRRRCLHGPPQSVGRAWRGVQDRLELGECRRVDCEPAAHSCGRHHVGIGRDRQCRPHGGYCIQCVHAHGAPDLKRCQFAQRGQRSNRFQVRRRIIPRRMFYILSEQTGNIELFSGKYVKRFLLYFNELRRLLAIWGTGGRRFKSSRSDQHFQGLKRGSQGITSPLGSK